MSAKFGEKSRAYQKNPEITLELLAHAIEQYLMQSEDMVCQMFQVPDGIVIQTKKRDEWKKYLLLDNAMQIHLAENEQAVFAQVGGGKWVSKAAVAGVGAVVAWPVAIPLLALSSLGGMGIYKLPDKILSFIDNYFACGGKVNMQAYGAPQGMGQFGNQAFGNNAYGNQPFGNQHPFNPSPTQSYQPLQPAIQSYQPVQQAKCPSCGAAIPANSKFCLSCGEKLEQGEN